MPETKYFNALEQALSRERLTGYRKSGDLSNAEAVSRYFLNICLCEALYPSLQGLEIALRNSVDAVVSDRHGEAWIGPTSYVLDQFRRNDVEAAIRRLAEQGKTSPSHADLVGSLGFGFWTGMFNTSYEAGNRRAADLWPHLLRQVFPNIPRWMRQRQRIEDFLQDVRRLRNRVFHHEPIWHYGNLKEKHSAILDGISWMSPELRDTIEVFDRFPSVHSDGEPPCRDKLIRHLERVNRNGTSPQES